MHLKSIKLAGFKSFAEPTVIPVGARLVGVVGPNGCGKSNVIDAVRWVLGESSARHLRGETMQDVIFGGTANRKPQGRASVELIFDNTEGRAPAQWGQYAELSVRRVLTRDGDSQYFINTVHVRRRDVQDIFLGTGLGPRAYAIVEQGMISRIIESKPEEIRVFLEEAAGVSKYRERRKETESRLNDSRQHLARTEDVQRELASRIETLTSQAAVAAEFTELKVRSTLLQDMLLLVKRRDAAEARSKANLDLERCQTEIEGETAKLREAERKMEGARTAQEGATERLQVEQGKLYEIDSDLGQTRQRLESTRAQKERLLTQSNQFEQEVALDEARLNDEESKEQGLTAGLEDARGRVSDVEARSLIDQEAQAPAERRLASLTEELDLLKTQFVRLEQALQVSRTERRNSERLIAELNGRLARSGQEKAELKAPDLGALSALTALSRDADIQAEILEAQRDRRQAVLMDTENHLAGLRTQLTEAQGALRRTEAEHEALVSLQEKANARGDAKAFLEAEGLSTAPRFWQSIQVESGWEDAVEAVLGARLSAVQLPTLSRALPWGDAAAAGGQSFFSECPAHEASKPAGIDALRTKVTATDADMQGLLDRWLSDVVFVPDLETAIARSEAVRGREIFVTEAGHVVSQGLLRFFSPRTEVHGALARAREIDGCLQAMGPLKDAVETLEIQVQSSTESLKSLRQTLNSEDQQSREIRARQRDADVERTRLAGMAERHQQRLFELQRSLDELQKSIEEESERLAEHTRSAEGLEQQIAEKRQTLEVRDVAFREALQSLEMVKLAVTTNEKSLQEAVFLKRTAEERLSVSVKARRDIEERLAQRLPQLKALREEMVRIDLTRLEEALQVLLETRSKQEAALTEARASYDAAVNAVHEIDRARLAAEQALHPLRERTQELKLKEQEARIHFDNAAEALLERQAEEAAIEDALRERGRTSGLQSEIAQLEKAMTALGPVNLAALAELETASERKAFLDAQVADLTEATETLESAMRKIDKETRELLLETFHRVNDSFSALFPTLFGGGQARIELTGEEILDSGVLVIAQPPGKKTSSIHLLSGGEKALTALSLVFALFQLNPAPFCLLDEVDAPLDETNTESYARLVKKMAESTQFLFISHNRIAMEMAEQLIGITMPEKGVSRVVAVDIDEAVRMSMDHPKKTEVSA